MELTIAIVATIALTLPAMERLFLAKEEPGTSRFRRRAVYVIVISALVLNVALNWIQYSNVKLAALNRQKSLERELAFSLWAYSNGEEPALKYLTSQHTASTNSFLLGYYYFHNGKDVLAERLLTDAISHHEFVAPSDYVLAIINAKNDPDLEHAKNKVKDGLEYDPDFSSLYVASALVHAMQHESGAAFKDLQHAVNLSPVHCYTVIRNGSDPSHPLNILHNDSAFQSLLARCKSYENGLLGVKD